MKRLTAILDLQFGSTGKGNVAGFIGQCDPPDVVVTAWSPNAGHTSIVKGVKLIHSQLANSIQSRKLKAILVGPGSVIDLKTLRKEIFSAYKSTGATYDIIVHPQAAVLLDIDAEEESKVLFKIGSTMKGSMAAVVRKMSRTDKVGTIKQLIAEGDKDEYDQLADWYAIRDHQTSIKRGLYCSAMLYQQRLIMANHVLIEGCQGYGLGINSGIYPFTTSRECTFAQMCVDTAMPLRLIAQMERLPRIIGVARTFPIRVANRYDDDGKQIGYSGPGWPDQIETTFGDIGHPVEYTTVTGLPRRIFEFSIPQVASAINASNVSEVFLTFADYLNPPERDKLIKDIEEATRIRVPYYTTGPTDCDFWHRD